MEDMKPAEPNPYDRLNSRLKFSGFSWRGSKKFKILIGLIALVAIAYKLFFVYVKPYEFGIKVVRVGMNRGVQEEVYQTGPNFILLFGLQQMHRLPKDIQVLELTNYPKTAAAFARREKAAHIQTSDGFFVDVDVSIFYRIVDPYKVFTTIGPGTLFEDNGIIPKAEPVLKATLGELTTEEFYNSFLRVEKAEANLLVQLAKALVKLQIAEAIQGKRIILLPISEGGMNLKTTDINQFINTVGLKSISGRGSQ